MQQELNILILGNNGRESALAHSILTSRRCHRLYADYASTDPRLIPTVLDPSDFEGVANFCREQSIGMIVVGPPEPIVEGIHDYLAASPGLEDLKIVAPTAAAARLEGSKEFAKEFMAETGIPSPRFMPVDEDTVDEGLAYLESMSPPYIIKADGLSDGRGVVICADLAEAKDVLEDMIIEGVRGEAGRHVLIEQFVPGQECSVIIATDGYDYVMLPVAIDYKRLGDGDNGPNTPGMGAYSPVRFADDEFKSMVDKHIITPTLRGLRERGIDYQGFLYFGIISVEGEPVVLEYNVRLGDPEAQAILPRIDSDIVELLEAIVDRRIGEYEMKISERAAISVVLTDAETHTERTTVTAVADTLTEARHQVYDIIDTIIRKNNNSQQSKQLYYRTDIGSEL